MSIKERVIKIAAEACRLLVGVVFIFSGFVKAVDPVGGAIKIDDYLTSFGLDFFKPFSVLLSFNLSALEFTLGICTLLGVYRRFTSVLIFFFMLVMTPLTLYLAIFNPVSNCGCFGDAVVISNWETFFKSLVLMGASVIILVYNQRLFQAYTYRAFWFIFFFSYIYCLGFCWYNYYHLPVIDFLPYKTGINITELMAIPEDAEEDEYQYSFVYAKDGVKKEFTLENYPANDTSWTFIEAKTKLIKEGFRPEIEDFHIYNRKDDDVTREPLNHPGPLILIIAPRLEKASDERIDEINNVYDYSMDHDIPFYCVTASGNEAIRRWTDYTGAEYEYLLADETLLKSMVRSNPGMILLREGTILKKWHYKDIPEEENIANVINSYLNGKENEIGKQHRRLRTNLLSFTLPLLLIWIYDYFRNRRRKKNEEEEKDEETI